MDSISVYTDDNIDSFKTDKLIELEMQMQMQKQKQKMETKSTNSFKNNGFSRRSGGNDGGVDPQNSNTNIDFHDDDDDVNDKTITELMTTDVAAENVEPDQLYMDDGAAVDEIEQRPTTMKSTEKLTNQKYVDDDDDDEPEIRVSKL